MASLSLRHVYKVYPNGKKAVSDFTMEIADKEFIVFVGPSGCGKSTTLRMIAGLEEITTGEISIDGITVNDVEPKDRDIAMVFQNYALYPHISVYENMAFGLRIRKIPKEEIHRRVLEAAEILGITEYLAKKPKEMSGGQRQRVALGRAIVREPKVFLLDEPLSNLDAKLRTQMRAEISKLHARLKTTFIYVTHDQTEAMTMGTRIVVMKDGIVRQIDTPHNLYSDPGSKFVASFIGTPQMNFYAAFLKREGGGVEITLPDAGLTWQTEISAFRKVRAEYLDGKHPVILGIRAERILPREGSDRSGAALCYVSHVEELGDEALVYGDLREENAGVTEQRTDVVFKVDAERGASVHAGDVLPITFDLRYAHFFDGETEESIRPRVPTSNSTDIETDGRSIRVAEMLLPLPEALHTLSVGRYTAEIPIDAIRESPSGARVTVEGYENVGEDGITYLRSGDTVVFAKGHLGDEGKEITVSIDFRRVSFYEGGECVQGALREKGTLYGAITREKVRVTEGGKTKKRISYGLSVADAHYPLPDHLLSHLVRVGGLDVVKKRLRFEIPPHAITVGVGENEGVVRTNLSYGDGEHYTVFLADGRELVAATDRAWEGKIRFSVDVGEITYIDDELDVILLS